MTREPDGFQAPKFPYVDEIDLVLSPPCHGWIDVSVRLGIFELKCSASTVLNDPLAELLDALCFMSDGHSGFRRVCFWLEPAGYAIDFQYLNETLAMLTVLHDDSFVPPMAASPMKELFRRTAPRAGVVRGLQNAISLVLRGTVVDGSKGDRELFERFRKVHAELVARKNLG